MEAYAKWVKIIAVFRMSEFVCQWVFFVGGFTPCIRVYSICVCVCACVYSGCIFQTMKEEMERDEDGA